MTLIKGKYVPYYCLNWEILFNYLLFGGEASTFGHCTTISFSSSTCPPSTSGGNESLSLGTWPSCSSLGSMLDWSMGPTTSKVGRTFEGSRKTLSPFSLRFNERNNFFRCFIKDLSDNPLMSTACPSSIICRSYVKKMVYKEESTTYALRNTRNVCR